MYINPSEIEKLKSINPHNYSLSLEYIRRYEKKLDNLEIIKTAYTYQIEALFTNQFGTFTINLEIDFMGNIHSYTCECYYQQDDIPCAHVFYVLHILQNIDEKAYIIDGEEKKQRQEELHNQFLIRSSEMFLDRYLDKEVKQWQSIISPNRYKLFADIKESNNQYSISFKVGEDKLYSIKNTQAFLEALDTHEVVNYGKSLKFIHDEALFDETSQKIIHFIRSILNKRFSLHSYYYYRSDSKNLLIDTSSIDEFYSTFAPLSEYYHNGSFGSYELLRVPFCCEKYNSKLFEFNSPLLSTDITLSNQYIYVSLENTLYRYTKETSTALLPLLNQLNAEGALYLSENMLSTFYYSVLEKNRKYIDMDLSIFETILEEDLNLRIYLELNSKEQITIDIFKLFEDKEIPLFDTSNKLSTTSSKVISLLTLLRALEIEDTKASHNRYVCPMSVDDFTKNVLPHLQEMGEVMVSSELMYKDKKAKYSITAGVHIEGDILKLSIQSNEIPKDEILSVLREYRRKKKFYKLKNGETLNLNSDELAKMSEMLDDLNVSDKDLVGEEINIPQYRAYTLEEMAKYNKEVELLRSENFSAFIKDLYTPQEVYDIPLPFAGILRDYQKEGYQWLKKMEHYGFGAILADDMGLGKTIQVLALLESSKQKGRTSLVVCPASLILNWEDEIRRFSTLSCLCVHGSSSTRELLIRDCMKYDLVITSYDFMRRDSSFYENKEFYYVILDEAQYIKNQTTRNAHCVKELHGMHKLALSGTPIENSLAELWSIFDFLMPNYLYPYSYFKTHFETPIVRFEDDGAILALKKLVNPFILRRNKKDVLKELPEKIESSLIMEFSEEEEKLYTANLALINQELAKDLGTEEYLDKMRILAMMTKLRQLCLDPRLIYTNIENVSTKIEGCMDLIKTAYENKKPILVFSSFTSLLALLEHELEKEGIAYLKLTGETPKDVRHKMVEQFQCGDIPVFLISLKAGGTGLNLTAAEVVIHFDPWWNQSAQNQATDRAYRFGQKNNVQVYKLIMKNSIEEKIMKLQEKKSELATAFVEQSEVSIASMSREDIMDLFK